MRHDSQKTYSIYYYRERKEKELKRLLLLFTLVVCVFLLTTGCSININIGSSSTHTADETTSSHSSDAPSNISSYQSRATILITTSDSEKPSICSSDLVSSKNLVNTYATILLSHRIQNKIHEEYPNIEYTLTLESLRETEIFAIIATSQNPERLEEICNMAVSLFCEEISLLIAGCSCKVIDCASSAQLVGAT